jgi:5-carboxymethyl-2-hydroxymuconate isomerase
MPQIIMQYSSGLQLDVPATLLAINQALLASGQFQAADIKSRAILLDDWLTGTKRVLPLCSSATAHPDWA